MTEEATRAETLLTLTSDIVAAHVSNNNVPLDKVSGLIRNIHGALSALGADVQPIEEVREPAVSIRSSVKPESITCLECGRKMKMLKRHIATEHDLGIEEYRQRWNLARDYPMVAPDYAAKRRDLAHKIGLGKAPNSRRGRPRKNP